MAEELPVGPKQQIGLIHLPNELLSLILNDEEISFRDILNFGSTCKRFNFFIKTNQILWKTKIKNTQHFELYNILEYRAKKNGNWLKEIEGYYHLKEYVCEEICDMSSKFYWRPKDVGIYDLKPLFDVAVSYNYFLTLWILIELHKKIRSRIRHNKRQTISPYTLTELHYTKMSLRYLTHTYHMVKWQQSYQLGNLTAEKVLHIFLQWMDTTHFHFEEDYQCEIEDIVIQVESLLDKNHPFRKTTKSDRAKWAHNSLCDNMWDLPNNLKILSAVTKIIYHQRHMEVTSECNMDTLDLVKVLNVNCGNPTTVAAIYEAVARRCGVRCDIIAFPNHLFMEWRESYTTVSPTYHLNLLNGELEVRRQCPYSQSNRANEFKFCPVSLIQYAITNYNKNVGTLRDYYSQNTFLLLEYLGSNENEHNPYKHFFNHLSFIMNAKPAVVQIPINVKYMHDVHKGAVQSLVSLNKPSEPLVNPILLQIPKRHDSRVNYAIGMVCSHLKYNYQCVIRGWDAYCDAPWEWQERMAIQTLERGSDQPFYNVLASDGSDRYVAQENLRPISPPRRLSHLEELLSREFTHFDEFAYVPNAQKKREYPGDEAIKEAYRARIELMRRQYSNT